MADPIQNQQYQTGFNKTQFTVSRTIGAGSTAFPVSFYTQVAGSYTITINPPNANFSTSGTLGPIASNAGQTIATPFFVGIPTDPGQLDTQATCTVVFTPTAGGPAQTYVQTIWLRCSNYVSASMTALNFYQYRCLADRWIRVHPGAAWGLVMAKDQPILFQFAAAAPNVNDTTGLVLPPNDTLAISTLSPALWVRGTTFWPGVVDNQTGDYQQFVGLLEVSK